MLTNKTLLWLSDNQVKLDKLIIDTQNLEESEEVKNKRIVAFFVELGEYANEERRFKFWSKKSPSELNIRLEEYIDGLHFIISIGNNINYNFDNFKFINNELTSINNYLLIINTLSNFIQNKNNQTYELFLNAFLNIMTINNYSEKEVIEMYKYKNKINQNRQNNNY